MVTYGCNILQNITFFWTLFLYLVYYRKERKTVALVNSHYVDYLEEESSTRTGTMGMESHHSFILRLLWSLLMRFPILDVITKQYIVPNMMTSLNGTTAKKLAKANIDAITMFACYDPRGVSENTISK